MFWYPCTTSLVLGRGVLLVGLLLCYLFFLWFLSMFMFVVVLNFYVYQMFLVYCDYYVYNVLSIMCNPTLIKTSKKINNVFGFNRTHQNMLGLAFVFWVLVSSVFYIFDFMLFFWKSITFWKFVVLMCFGSLVASVLCLCIIYSLCVTCIMYLCHMFCLFDACLCVLNVSNMWFGNNF